MRDPKSRLHPNNSAGLLLLLALIAVFSLAASALLAGLGPGRALAQKIRERGTETRSSEGEVAPESRNDESAPEDVHIQIRTGKGDTSDVVINARSWRRHHVHTGRDSTDVVRLGEDITIGPDQVVPGDVVAIGGSVHVLGRVKGDVVSIGGNVDLEDGGAVEGDAVSIGGTVNRGAAARIGGQNIGMRFIPAGIFRLWRPRPILTVFLTLIKVLFLFFVGYLLIVLAETRVRRTGAYLQDHLWLSLLTGIAVQVLFLPAFVLLCITIIGIPLALISPLALAVAMLIGYLVVAGLVGLRVLKDSGTVRSLWIRGIGIGILIFEGIPFLGRLVRWMDGGVFSFFGIVLMVFGFAVIYISATIGLGALVLSRFGQERAVPLVPPPQQPVAPPYPA
jgi:cytoskeletal protein CcmA (bactofilin family)